MSQKRSKMFKKNLDGEKPKKIILIGHVIYIQKNKKTKKYLLFYNNSMLQNINNSPLWIEIMPAEKSCEQWCTHCPLSSRNNPVKNRKINKQVQTSFSLLEKRVKDEWRMYDVHFSSRLDLFPMLQHPELLQMLRFETNRWISEDWAINKIISKYEKLISDKNINPNHVCFSFVPKWLTLSTEDVILISDMMKKLWKLYNQDTEESKTISCTVRSNFVPEKKFKDFKPNTDTRRLKKVISNIWWDITWGSKEAFDDAFITLYRREINGSDKTNNHIKYEISNRILIHHQITSDLKNNFLQKSDWKFDYQQIQAFYSSKVPTHYLIAPEWVMISHKSDAINNPIYWITHNDFSKILEHYNEKTVEEIGKIIFEQNWVIYSAIRDILVKNDQNPYTVPKKDYMIWFEKNREYMFKLDDTDENTTPPASQV